MPTVTEYIIDESPEQLARFQERLADLFAGARVNFLFGSGFSRPHLSTLGSLEDILTHLSKQKTPPNETLNAYLLWLYFQNCMYGIADLKPEALTEQKRFADLLYRLMNERSTPVLSKQINIFTTNYDPILELVFDANRNITYNDGFEGRINPYFSSSNFSKLIYRQAIFSNNKVEVPVINILKIHGSVTWEKTLDAETMGYSNYQEKLRRLYDQNHKSFSDRVLEKMDEILFSQGSVPSLADQLAEAVRHAPNSGGLERFLEHYEKELQIVNPTKEKFDSTIMNITYHELIRIFSNELEKENTVLLVFGFSFKDEHILEITKRSIINPTLQIYIFCFNDQSAAEMKLLFQIAKNNNVFFIRYKGASLDLTIFNNVLQSIVEDKGDFIAK